MTIYPLNVGFMKFEVIQFIVERYYRHKLKKTCFIMKQNERWTIVFVNR